MKKANAPYSAQIFGVISTSPQQVIGADIKHQGAHPMPVALMGRVPVRATDENGPIKAGDYLTAASSPGAAMRATEPGHVIGKALTGLDQGEGYVMAFVERGFGGNDGMMSEFKKQQRIIEEQKDQIDEMDKRLRTIEERIKVSSNSRNEDGKKLSFEGAE